MKPAYGSLFLRALSREQIARELDRFLQSGGTVQELKPELVLPKRWAIPRSLYYADLSPMDRYGVGPLVRPSNPPLPEEL